MFSFENRNKVLPITNKKEFMLFNPNIHKSKPQPKATILKHTENNVVYLTY